MSRRRVFRVVFLTLTALALGTEVLFAWDGDPDTEPWTDLIVRHVPMEVTVAAIGALCLWLPVHFGLRYWRRRRE